jgi:subtilisin family serine protease
MRYKNIIENLVLLLMLFAFFPSAQCQTSFADSGEVPGCLLVKVKSEFRGLCDTKNISQSDVSKIITSFNVNTLARVFPTHNPPGSKFNSMGFPLVDLSLIYEIRFDKNIPNSKLITALMKTGVFEYVEPRIVPLPLFTPDDPKIGSEYYIPRINAFEAWEIAKGDSSVVIGIVDTGTDTDHEDLTGNLKYNYNDPIDGVDNDNDTYVDNFRGWDLGDNDNDPQVSPGGGNSSHGVLICGIAAASTHNQVGVAGVGFKCRFLPVKVADASGGFNKPFEGIVYAADHNCAIINCSWGGPVYAGQFGQDVVNYATFNKNALVIAAAGNDGFDYPYYPASYNNVISVAATDANDERMYVYPGYATTYGYFIDVCAPGQNIFSTWDYPYFYKSLSGTSMACAVASAAAAIIKSKFPGLSALQLAEKLRVSCDSVDHLPANIPYRSKLGMGRINLFKAVAQDTLSSLRIKRSQLISNTASVPGPGDTVALKAVFINYLQPSSNLKITIQTTSPFITILDSVFTTPMVGTLDSVNNFSQPFRFIVHPNIPASHMVYFKVIYVDDKHRTFEFLPALFNLDFLTIENGEIKTTITSKGRIGYNDNLKTQGCGFMYKNFDSFLSNAGLMIGTSYTKVSDAVINASNTGFDNDFKTKESVHFTENPVFADKETITVFNDSLAGSNVLGCSVTQKTFTWDDPEDEKFVILEYRIKNTNQNALSFLYAGLFADWDINAWTSNQNRVLWDSATRTGYTSHIDGWPLLGISLISDGPVKHYAFDINGSNSSIKLTDGFTASEKYTAMKSNRNLAGTAAQGNDVADLVSSGPFLIQPGDSVVVAFALAAADYTEELKNVMTRARLRYHNAIGIPELSMPENQNCLLLPNPFQQQTNLKLKISETESVVVEITDLQGRFVKSVYAGILSPGIHILPVELETQGCFLISIKTGSFKKSLRIVNVYGK